MKRLITFIGLGILAFNTFSIAPAQGGEVTPNCVTPPSGIVGWWKGDGNAVDTVGGNNGVEQGNTYTAGVVGQAFAFNPSGYTGIQIADQPAYALTNSLTIEGWVRPRGDGYVIFWRGDNRPGLDPYTLSMGGDNTLGFGICDADGNSASIETSLVYGQWTHVAATLDGGSGAMSIYTNGVLAAQAVTAIRPFGILEADQSPGVGIGNLNDGGNNFPFTGDIDEIALYNRALIPSEILSIYNAGSAGKCAGSLPPGISVQPVGQTTVEGSNVVLSVVANGTGPFHYQWTFNETNLTGATNATLNLANLHPNQSGNYSVIISTTFGSITSSIVNVTVVAQDILVYKFSATEKITTAGQETSLGYSGEMFFIPASTNGTFVGWDTVNGKKQFWVNPFSDYLLITIPGSARRTYTMLGKAGQEIDADGHPHIWSYLHKGLNASLTIATQRQFSFPQTFSTSETHAYPDLQTSNMVLIESTSAYIFLPSNTQAANNNGQTMTDLVNTLTSLLTRQGYKQR